MKKVVLDTNVFVSSLLTRGTPPHRLYCAWESGRFSLVTSVRQIEELTRVLGYEKLRPYIQPFETSLVLENIDSMADIVNPRTPRTESSDPDDNWILATAVEGRVNLLVTGDKGDLLSLKKVAGIPIVSAKEAIKILKVG